jgi:hypothetical protein
MRHGGPWSPVFGNRSGYGAGKPLLGTPSSHEIAAANHHGITNLRLVGPENAAKQMESVLASLPTSMRT